VLHGGEEMADVISEGVVFVGCFCGVGAGERVGDGIGDDFAVAVGNVGDKHVAELEREFDTTLLKCVPPAKDGG